MAFFLLFISINSIQISALQATNLIIDPNLRLWTTAVKWRSQRKVLIVAGRSKGPRLREILNGGLSFARNWGEVN